jgi:transformation/transcription domain-associated protein
MVNFSQIQSALVSTSSVNEIAKIIGELRDRVEIVHSSEFSNFLHYLFPPLRDILSSRISPQLVENEENKIRLGILEILNKFPTNEVLKPYVFELMTIALKVFVEDNEDNAIIALKIIFELHKSFRPALEPSVQPFLDAVLRIYNNMPNSVRIVFSVAPTTAAEVARARSLQNGEPVPLIPLKSVESFKVLTECPLIVMLLFQFYPKCIPKAMQQMVPQMLNFLTQSPTPSGHIAVARAHKIRFREFLSGQVREFWISLSYQYDAPTNFRFCISLPSTIRVTTSIDNSCLNFVILLSISLPLHRSRLCRSSRSY